MQWLEIGFRVAPYIVAAVSAVEKFLKGAKGKEKQDAALDMIGTFVLAAEGAVGKDLLDDTQVQIAARNAIDAFVAFQNTVAAVKAARNIA